MNTHPLKTLVEFKNNKQAIGIYSACTSNKFALEACMEKALNIGSLVLIEATSNQVNQYGGYSGKKPDDFRNFVYEVATKVGLPIEHIILGGDHLGPLTFCSYNEAKAMEEASELIRQYIMASFTKIHIDTSMKLASDDPHISLSNELIATRCAKLVMVAENAYIELLKSNKYAIRPVYIIGSEVPIPGGNTDSNKMEIEITKPADLKKTVEVFEQVFNSLGIDNAWSRVIAIVVQPGIEENSDGCVEYDRLKAHSLMQAIKDYPNLMLEGHSTDYQTKDKLRELIEDGISILKVGPALTFAFREALFALSYIESELYKGTDTITSNFIHVLEDAMTSDSKYWSSHYHGNDVEIAFKCKFSFSDRSRYYFHIPNVITAMDTLINNLRAPIPLSLLSQFMPIQYTKVREGLLDNNPYDLIKDRIKYTIDEYLFATNQDKIPI